MQQRAPTKPRSFEIRCPHSASLFSFASETTMPPSPNDDVSPSPQKLNHSSSPSPSSSPNEAAPPNTSSDLMLVVDDLLEQMQSRFDNMGKNILGRMDEMAKRMDVLEQSVNELMDQAGLDREEIHRSSSLRTTTPRSSRLPPSTPNKVTSAEI